MNSVFLPWMVEVGIIGARGLVRHRRLPLPSELLSTFVVFGGLGIAAESAGLRSPATATAWGLVVATFLSSNVDFLGPVGEFFGGTGPSASTPMTITTAPPGATSKTGGGAIGAKPAL